MAYGDCSSCANKINKALCHECQHKYILYDHYEEALPEVIEANMEKLRQAAEAALIDTYIDINLPKAFKEIFSKAKSFASTDPDRSRYMAVHALYDRLIASNSFNFAVELMCDVPPALRNKHIVRVEKGRVAIASKINVALTFREVFFKPEVYMPHPDLDQLFVLSHERLIFNPTKDIRIHLKAELCKAIVAALGPLRRIGYTGPKNAVVFESALGQAFLLPLWMSEEQHMAGHFFLSENAPHIEYLNIIRQILKSANINPNISKPITSKKMPLV